MQRINYGAARAKARDTGQGSTKRDRGRALAQTPCSLQGQSCCSPCSSPSPCTVLQVRHLLCHHSGSGSQMGTSHCRGQAGNTGMEWGWCCWQEDRPPGRGRVACPGVQGRMERVERVLGGLSKAGCTTAGAK